MEKKDVNAYMDEIGRYPVSHILGNLMSARP